MGKSFLFDLRGNWFIIVRIPHWEWEDFGLGLHVAFDGDIDDWSLALTLYLLWFQPRIELWYDYDILEKSGT
jgi:hypothetical protein